MSARPVSTYLALDKAYHSQFNDVTDDFRSVGNMTLLPIKTKIRGPAPHLADQASEDIIDEALNLFRANCLFRNFEIKGGADRVLIYLILFISDCLTKLTKNPPKGEAVKQLTTLALNNFAIPGDPTFPLNAMYATPADRADGDALRQYLQQLRQELAIRLVERVYVDGKPSKWWMCFQKRKFMNLSL
ncbi:actin-related protein 2/3 complex subunit 3 [Jimgerdemannia flammicorona]|uniref:Actin-related protein 2/3 complex subunit 3 n=1 Tax=Jimgerdemannia flammicorona TaxID=994334 RepID=A0A433D186_9FUNG|nr:actin-related protein 2/3 complex subunit 3 [Jimgerdemannia flammicorona]